MNSMFLILTSGSPPTGKTLPLPGQPILRESAPFVCKQANPAEPPPLSGSYTQKDHPRARDQTAREQLDTAQSAGIAQVGRFQTCPPRRALPFPWKPPMTVLDHPLPSPRAAFCLLTRREPPIRGSTPDLPVGLGEPEYNKNPVQNAISPSSVHLPAPFSVPRQKIDHEASQRTGAPETANRERSRETCTQPN